MVGIGQQADFFFFFFFFFFRTPDKPGLWKNKEARVQPTWADTTAWWLLDTGGKNSRILGGLH